MPTQKIKFKMSVKELSFEFEGDVETGQRIQSDIRKSLTALTHSPAAVLPADPNTIDAESTVAPANGKTKRARRSRVKGHTPRAQLVALKAEGFFDQKRDLAAIRNELAKKGHNFESSEISASLTPLLKKGVFTRDKQDGSNYEYEKGPNDDDSGSADDSE